MDARLTIVGSGTLAPDPERGSAAHHVRVGRASILFDCGPGTLHALPRHGIDWPAITHVAITHYHNDHFADLFGLLIALTYGVPEPRSEPVTLVGPVGFRAHVVGVAEALGSSALDGPLPVDVVELAPGTPLESAGRRFTLRCVPTPHTAESVAYRLDGAWGSVGYTGDTAPDPELAPFFDGVSVLVAECSSLEPRPGERHLTARDAAELARVSRPDVLVLTHVYAPLTPEKAVRAVGAEYDGRVLAGRDGMTISISDGRCSVDPRRTAV